MRIVAVFPGSRVVAVAALAALLAGACSHGTTPRGPRGFVPPGGLRADSVALPEVRADGSSTPFRFVARPGGLLLVYFGYTTCPDVCPTTLADLHTALRRLGADSARVEIAFVTVDVARDTAAALVPYLAAFVTAGHPLRARNEAELSHAERAFGASSQVTHDARGAVVVNHTGTTYVVDERGRIRLEWGFGTTPRDMSDDLRLLLAGARSGAR